MELGGRLRRRPDATIPSTRKEREFGASMTRGRMVVEVVFNITGRGAVVCADSFEGTFHVGDTVTISRPDGQTIKARISGIPMEILPPQCSLLIADITKDDVHLGDVVETIQSTENSS